MKFTFPSDFSFLDMLALARQGQFDPMAFRGQIELDFSSLDFAGPGAMACIKALLAREQRMLSPEVCFSVYHNFQDAVRYLKRMDFFTDDIRWRMTREAQDFIRHPSEGDFMPMRNLHQLSETDSASREMSLCLNTDPVSSGVFQYVLSELIDNALQHSDSSTGAFVTAQKYDKSGTVHLLIVDTGIGIRGHLLKNPRYHQTKDDIQAIKTALTPFVTGTPVANSDDRQEYDNQGLGLSVTDQIAKRGSGELYLWTGKALYHSLNGEAESMPVKWPGTVVFLTLPIRLAVNPTDVVKGFDVALPKPKIRLKFNS